MAYFKNFYITCSSCQHRNRPNPSPRVSVRMTLLGQAGDCRNCGKTLKPVLDNRPLVVQVRAELAAEGLTTTC